LSVETPTRSASIAGISFSRSAIGGLLADRHDDRQRHAALARRTEGRARQIVDDLVEIGVGHDDAVVLGAAHRLDALSGGDAALIDIMRDVGRADEADRRDGGMIEDRVDHFLVAMDDLEMPSGRPASMNSSARRTGTDGSRSLGLSMKALPVAMRRPTSTAGSSPGS
jgi:hypothetical protein